MATPKPFTLVAPFAPTGDQPEAIRQLTAGLADKKLCQTLLGVTGSGKTFTLANVIEKFKKPTLVISHNKTLAAQLAEEFQDFFPTSAVHYFVSYYDYYQPEAYIPSSDTYIEKETQINEEIDRLRHAATQSLLSRRDVIIVASVSCIYGLGSPEEYERQHCTITRASRMTPRDLMKKLVELQYERNDIESKRGTFRFVGGNLDILQPFSSHILNRICFSTKGISDILSIDRITGKVIDRTDSVSLFPATHYLAPKERFQEILEEIEQDMQVQVRTLKQADKILEAARLEQRTTFDLEMLRSVGYCSGVENYSRYFDNRTPGEPPFTLIDYFTVHGKKDFLLCIDESHMTIPQIRAMYNGDRARKDMLVQYGFRLNAAYDNRPLTFAEFEAKMPETIFVSATPGPYEISKSTPPSPPLAKGGMEGGVVEQLIRPTGLLDPEIEVRPSEGQIDDIIREIEHRIIKKQRVLVTTLTKRMAEDLTNHLKDSGLRVAYIHSEVDTFDRLDILEKLRMGFYDCLIGINLLREGLDLPEVSLVAILDADKEGFLRSKTAFLQIAGRAARHVEGRVIMYADRMTDSMRFTIDETARRRTVQIAYNQAHGITPKTIVKEIKKGILSQVHKTKEKEIEQQEFQALITKIHPLEAEALREELQSQMELASQNWEFEKAAQLRDRIRILSDKISKRPKGKFDRLKQLAQE